MVVINIIENFLRRSFDLSHGGLRDSTKRKKQKSYDNNTYIKKFNILGLNFNSRKTI